MRLKEIAIVLIILCTLFFLFGLGYIVAILT